MHTFALRVSLTTIVWTIAPMQSAGERWEIGATAAGGAGAGLIDWAMAGGWPWLGGDDGGAALHAAAVAASMRAAAVTMKYGLERLRIESPW
jgi:hypothetical protein